MKLMPEEQKNHIRLEKINCPVCNGSEDKLIFMARDLRLMTFEEMFNIVRCVNCGFIFLNPRPAKDEVISFYPSNFNQETPTLIHKIWSVCLSPIENSIIRTIKNYKKSGKLLDIGCGSGRFLSLMQKQGFDVWGCELNLNSKDFAPKFLDGRIFYKELSKCNLASKSFDVVLMIQSLEHVNQLDELVIEIRRVIKDNGIVFIYVPNMEFFEFRLFGAYYYNLEAPRHLYCFTRRSISNLLSRHGFKVDRFFRKHLLEIFSSPTSLHYGLWSYWEDKNILKNKALKRLTFFPLVIIGFILRFFLFFEEQNLTVVCYKD
ncbi:MAG: class I SAM-dependent methyltransferase [Candidatus Omnitrophica bacterium]|nr:class I SAM-dependent methyltransferase [Candidatus Omnitrophota bacterium]